MTTATLSSSFWNCSGRASIASTTSFSNSSISHWSVIRATVESSRRRIHPGGNQMNEARSPETRVRALGAVVAVVAIVAGGVVWSGCGSSSSDSSDSTAKAQKEIEAGAKKAEEGVKQGSKEAEKGFEEAKKGFENGKAQAEKGIEEAKKYAEEYSP